MSFLPTQQTLSIGGRVFTDLANLISLAAIGDGTLNNATFREAGSGAGYQVPVGKTLKIVAIKTYSNGNNCNPIFNQSDNDVGWGTNTAFTNPVDIVSGNAGADSQLFNFGTEIGISFEVVGNPLGIVEASKYLSVNMQGQTNAIFVFGYLE